MIKLQDIRHMKMTDVKKMTLAPVNEQLPPQKRFESCLLLSELMSKMATHVICHTIVDHADLLNHDRISVANAFLQRVTSTHMCNHKLTKEGIVYYYKGETFKLHEEFKTMTLTRSVYEHLAMFYFLFVHPQTDEQRSVVWNYWKINSKKNLLGYSAEGDEFIEKEQDKASEEIEALRKEIFSTQIGKDCRQKLDEWTNPKGAAQNGSIEFYQHQGKTAVRRVSYGQAWKYLFENEEMTLLYRHLSMHSHPVYNGLLQYQSQSETDEGNDGIPLYLSSCFLAYLCRLFIQLIPQMKLVLQEDFSEQERFIFNKLSQLPHIRD